MARQHVHSEAEVTSCLSDPASTATGSRPAQTPAALPAPAIATGPRTGDVATGMRVATTPRTTTSVLA